MTIAVVAAGKRLDVYIENGAPNKIALVNLVESQKGSKEYRYVATRIYDTETDTVVDEVLASKGRAECMSREVLQYAVWHELPMLDVRTQQLVGKNKDRYCTLIAVKAFLLMDTDKDTAVCSCNVTWLDEVGSKHRVVAGVRVLGYTFMDINGDKQYLTLAQLRASDIVQHTHSMCVADMYKRVYLVAPRTTCIGVPALEISAVDTTLDDEEVEQTKLLKTLVGGWHTMGADGAIWVDREEIKKQRLEELEVPEGILRVPSNALANLDTVKRIKLPESLQAFDRQAIYNLANLEEINIPSKVKVLQNTFMGCGSIKSLDLSGVECLTAFAGVGTKRLIMPDVLQKNEYCGRAAIGVLEFRNMPNAEHRVLKAMTGRLVQNTWSCRWSTERIETNGPVILGNYKASICCIDTSALEPNIVGIAPDSSFYKVDAQGHWQPWLLGPTTEFVYTAKETYQFTPDACAANKLRVVVVNTHINTVLPKSVEIMQGELSKSMLKADYPNVVYASQGLCSQHMSDEGSSVVTKLPALRWILPKGEVLTEAQIKRLEKKLTPILPEICEYTQEVLKLDLTKAENLVACKEGLLTGSITGTWVSFNHYGMIYVGDYNEVLRGKQ